MCHASKDDNGASFRQIVQFFHNFIGFFGHGLVQILAGFIVLVDQIGFFQCGGEILFDQQFYGFLSVLYTAGRIDTGTNLENDVAYGDFLFAQTAYINDGFQANTWIGVQLFQSVVSQDTVFSHDRNNVGGNADRYQIKQWGELMEINAVVDGKCLHKLEADTTSG